MNILIIVAVLLILFVVAKSVISGLKLKQQDYATPLKSWAQSGLNNESKLQAWLLALPEEGLQALGEKVHEFAVEMDLDLNWLTDPEAESLPEARQAAEEMVTDYCKLCMKTVQKQ